MVKIVGLSFPPNDPTRCLEPSLLTVLPDGDDVKYLLDNNQEEEADVYLCSVYTSGYHDFLSWAKNKDTGKIIVGGYHPTLSPEDFKDHARKIVVGAIDNINLDEILGADRQTIKGTMKMDRMPRYDLYDSRMNEQTIPDKRPGEPVVSLNTTYGCRYRCNFCCSPKMYGGFLKKPLWLVEKEIRYLERYMPKYLFIRDENFMIADDWKERLEIVSQAEAKVYMFASTNLLDKEKISILKKNGVYMICLGLDDIQENYRKNRNFFKVCDILNSAGIYVYLSFIINPLTISQEIWEQFIEAFHRAKAAMIVANFLMPFPSTGLYERYKNLISVEDYKHFDSKQAFLEKKLLRRKKMEYDMFVYQWLYFTSDEYNRRRKFFCGDTLSLKFMELRNLYFDYKLWQA